MRFTQSQVREAVAVDRRRRASASSATAFGAFFAGLLLGFFAGGVSVTLALRTPPAVENVFDGAK